MRRDSRPASSDWRGTPSTRRGAQGPGGVRPRASLSDAGERTAPAGHFRLRGLIAAAGALSLVALLVPRMRAAWQLQSMAAAFANYALCMVGPTGPSLL